MEITKDMVDWEEYLAANQDFEMRPPLSAWGSVCESLGNDKIRINKEFAPYLTDEAKSAVVKEYAPECCHLYFVNYDDNLEERIDWLEECVQSNSLMPLSDRVYDMWDCPEQYELGEIRRALAADGLDELYDELYDEFCQCLWDRDYSDPVKDLLRNTSGKACFYSLGVEVGGWTEPAFLCESRRTTEESEEVAKILKALGLPADHPSAHDIETMVAQASYGGDLRIYFNSGIEDLIAGEKYDNESEDFRSVHIKGDVCVCIANPGNGSGDFCEVKGVDVVLPFDRENLHISRMEKYCAEEIYGMADDWVRGYDSPSFSLDPAPEGASIGKSSVNAEVAREAECNRVFEAGGCTYGDRDMNRHRNVYYRNYIPCGCVCPHCGTFWID